MAVARLREGVGQGVAGLGGHGHMSEGGVWGGQEDTNAHSSGPAVVHCSAGIGRTGTFCAVDIALRRLRALHPSDTFSATQAVKVRPQAQCPP